MIMRALFEILCLVCTSSDPPFESEGTNKNPGTSRVIQEAVSVVFPNPPLGQRPFLSSSFSSSVYTVLF
jgi:hypothetical protein